MLMSNSRYIPYACIRIKHNDDKRLEQENVFQCSKMKSIKIDIRCNVDLHSIQSSLNEDKFENSEIFRSNVHSAREFYSNDQKSQIIHS